MRPRSTTRQRSTARNPAEPPWAEGAFPSPPPRLTEVLHRPLEPKPRDTTAMSRDTVHRFSGHRSFRSLWLVVPGRLEDRVAEQLSAGAKHADVPVVDQHEDLRAGVATAQADVVQPAVVPQRELPLVSIL